MTLSSFPTLEFHYSPKWKRIFFNLKILGEAFQAWDQQALLCQARKQEAHSRHFLQLPVSSAPEGNEAFPYTPSSLAGQETEPSCSRGKNQPLEKATGRAVLKREMQELSELLFWCSSWAGSTCCSHPEEGLYPPFPTQDGMPKVAQVSWRLQAGRRKREGRMTYE